MSVRPQELLDMRLTALVQDVERVSRIAEGAQRRHESHNRLSRLVGGNDREPISTPLQKVSQFLTALRDAIEDDPALEEAIGRHDFAAHLETVRTELRNARRKVREVKEALSTIDSLMIKVDAEDTTFTNGLGERCQEIQDTITALKADLLDPGVAPREVWQKYEDAREKACHSLFADYVDFLGGLTLRDTSLDDDVCTIADELVKDIPGQVKRLAVPACRPGPNAEWHELVKLGFAEWTVWNVPHIAYEVGKVHAEGRLGRRIIGQMQHLLPDRPAAAYQELFAEAYGAYTVGPAYGCAVMLLKLQPDHDAERGLDPSDVERSAVVHVVLKMIGAESAGFNQLVDSTEEYWREAVVHLGSETALDTAQEQVAPFATGITEALEQEHMLPFNARVWSDVTKLAAQLEALKVRPTGEVDTRVLLNAAWVARLKYPRSQPWADRVTANVRGIWRPQPDNGTEGSQ